VFGELQALANAHHIDIEILFPSWNKWTPTTHSHFNYSCKYLCHSPFYNFVTSIASLIYVTNFLFKVQGKTDALSRLLDTQKKLPEEAITILSWATRKLWCFFPRRTVPFRLGTNGDLVPKRKGTVRRGEKKSPEGHPTPYCDNSTQPLKWNQEDSYHQIQFPAKPRMLLVSQGDKKRLAYPVHKNFPINRYFIGL